MTDTQRQDMLFLKMIKIAPCVITAEPETEREVILDAWQETQNDYFREMQARVVLEGALAHERERYAALKRINGYWQWAALIASLLSWVAAAKLWMGA